MEATKDELLLMVQEMYPREYDRALAELTIRKQAERIAELEARQHTHTHDDEPPPPGPGPGEGE